MVLFTTVQFYYINIYGKKLAIFFNEHASAEQFRSVFSQFPYFNIVQSRVFDEVSAEQITPAREAQILPLYVA